MFSVERTENNKNHALRAIKIPEYRVAIDYFSFVGVSAKNKKNQKNKMSNFISKLRLLAFSFLTILMLGGFLNYDAYLDIPPEQNETIESEEKRVRPPKSEVNQLICNNNKAIIFF